ncbi:hypothetical protein [Anaeromicrobium sediminis]|uniref:hypothetical protein n=1 Tax=Anaeromicrobium sediminis TaxID=1478221 RepID=UPI0015963083|nr:hypothetical protein [Anaeromicrobium sediminis]
MVKNKKYKVCEVLENIPNPLKKQPYQRLAKKMLYDRENYTYFACWSAFNKDQM